MKAIKPKLSSIKMLAIISFVLFSSLAIMGPKSYGSGNLKLCGDQNTSCYSSQINLSDAYGCGSNSKGSADVDTSIDFGCKGDQCVPGNSHYSPTAKYCTSAHDGIADLLFAIIRFLSDGVGIIVVLSIIIGGIQYLTSRGDPNATQSAIKRLTSALTALLVFIFAYAILNYVIPNGFFGQ